MAYTWDVAKPADSDNISIGAAQIRTDKISLDTFFKEFSNWPTDGYLKEGSARIFYDLIVNKPSPAKEGRMFYGSDSLALEVDTGSTWKLYAMPVCVFYLVEVLRVAANIVRMLINDAAWADVAAAVDVMADPKMIYASGKSYGATPTAQLWVIGLVGTGAAGKVRLYDITAGAAVTGSECDVNTADTKFHLYSSAAFNLAVADHQYKVQAYKVSGAADYFSLNQVMLRVTPSN